MPAVTDRLPVLRAAPLFDVDPEIADALEPGQRAQARERAIVAVFEPPTGTWSPSGLDSDSHPFALLVLDGLIMREQVLAGSTATELLGPGDIVDFKVEPDALVPSTVFWTVPERATVALLDDRLLSVIRMWPSVGRVVFQRLARRGARLATHRAIAQLPRVEQRLVAYFAHIAERWGRVGPSGLVVPLHLTHETLGRLIGARRPTVSLALKELANTGMVERRGDGAWVIHPSAFSVLEPSDPGSWQPAEARKIDLPEPPPPAPRRLAPEFRPQELAALRQRVASLAEEHDARLKRCATVIERSRATRAALRLVLEREPVDGR